MKMCTRPTKFYSKGMIYSHLDCCLDVSTSSKWASVYFRHFSNINLDNFWISNLHTFYLHFWLFAWFYKMSTLVGLPSVFFFNELYDFKSLIERNYIYDLQLSDFKCVWYLLLPPTRQDSTQGQWLEGWS